MNQFDNHWQRLVTAARRAPDTRDTTVPYGFSTRIVARAFAVERPLLSVLFERFSLRALWVAGLLVLVSFAMNYSARANGEEESADFIDPVGELLAAS